MTAQFPAIRLSVARQMEAYRERLAERIDKELQRRGEDHNDLAHGLRINPRTAERWVSGDTVPQRRMRKPLADYFDIPIEELWPDLEAEGKALQEQLDRIESKLDQIISRLAGGQPTPEEIAQAEARRRRGKPTPSRPSEKRSGRKDRAA